MSDVVRRRVAAVLLVFGALVVVLAISDTGPFSDPPSTEDEVRATVEAFFGAASAGDSATFCAMLTDDARRGLRVQTAQRLQTDRLPKCERIIDALVSVFKGSEVAVSYVSVSGDRARVEARYRLSKAAAQPRTVLLVDEHGEWRISDPG